MLQVPLLGLLGVLASLLCLRRAPCPPAAFPEVLGSSSDTCRCEGWGNPLGALARCSGFSSSSLCVDMSCPKGRLPRCALLLCAPSSGRVFQEASPGGCCVAVGVALPCGGPWGLLPMGSTVAKPCGEARGGCRAAAPRNPHLSLQDGGASLQQPLLLAASPNHAQPGETGVWGGGRTNGTGHL